MESGAERAQSETSRAFGNGCYAQQWPSLVVLGALRLVGTLALPNVGNHLLLGEERLAKKTPALFGAGAL
jgi:hypothetical protein